MRLSSRPTALAVTRENLWLATSSVGAPIAAKGTLRINRPDDEGDAIDPALAWSPSAFQRAAATCAGLLGYPEIVGEAGLRLRPELARSMPSVSADGLTYTFTLRPGYRFAPPSGASVAAADVKASVERALSPRWPGGQPPGAVFLSDLAGFARFRSGASEQISGITVRGSTISFRLVQAAPDFPVRLAMPFFCTLPRGAPIGVGGMGGPIPSAGPYYIASGRASSRPHRIVLLRNPGYIGPKSRNPERIVYDIGPDGEETRSALEAGTTDYSDGQMLDATYRRLLANRTDAHGASASNGQPQLYANPTFDAVYLVLNTSRPLFADAERRKQVMRAIDRKKLLASPVRHPGGIAERPVPPARIPGIPRRGRGTARRRNDHHSAYAQDSPTGGSSPGRQPARVLTLGGVHRDTAPQSQAHRDRTCCPSEQRHRPGGIHTRRALRHHRAGIRAGHPRPLERPQSSLRNGAGSERWFDHPDNISLLRSGNRSPTSNREHTCGRGSATRLRRDRRPPRAGSVAPHTDWDICTVRRVLRPDRLPALPRTVRDRPWCTLPRPQVASGIRPRGVGRAAPATSCRARPCQRSAETAGTSECVLSAHGESGVHKASASKERPSCVVALCGAIEPASPYGNGRPDVSSGSERPWPG